jgi:hypothetical protein
MGTKTEYIIIIVVVVVVVVNINSLHRWWLEDGPVILKHVA